MRQYWVYIMASKSRVIYVGVTGNLERRVWEHKLKLVEGFTKRYNCTRLVHCEYTDDVSEAIRREKEIKGWTRARKIALIESENPRWADLAEGR